MTAKMGRLDGILKDAAVPIFGKLVNRGSFAFNSGRMEMVLASGSGAERAIGGASRKARGKSGPGLDPDQQAVGRTC
jgi:hypothetical protein